MSESGNGGSAGQDGRPHAIVIGGGYGGLAAAIRLGARGFRVTVCERLDKAGGCGYVHKRDGFTFDAGPTLVTPPYLFEDLWRLCGRKLADDIDLRPMSPFYQLRFADGAILDYSGDHDAMHAQIDRFSPSDSEGFDRFLLHSEKIYRIAFEQFAHVPFDSLLDKLKFAPGLLRLRPWRSVYDMVAGYVSDPNLRRALSFHPTFVGGNPFTVPALYSLLAVLERRWGVHYPIGGTGSMVKGLVALIEGQGNQLRYKSEVAEITLAGRRASGVRLLSGETIAGDLVVSDADPNWTYRNLLPASARRHWTNRRLDRLRYSMGVFVWHFGTKKRYEHVKHHTIMFGPRYRELLGDIFQRQVLAEDFNLYINRPTATDRSMAPPGCDSFYVLSAVPHLGSGVDWNERAEPYRRSIAKHLSQTLLPDLENQVVTSLVTTPLDFRFRLLTTQGAAFGMQPEWLQCAWFRPHNKSEDVDHLYLVGASTHPGAGLPGVLSSARILDTVVPAASAFR